MKGPVRSSRSAPIKSAKHLAGFSSTDSLTYAFGVDNAKHLQTEEAVRYFVPPKEFPALFNTKNHILLGSRGSGKTMWIRMMAHDHVLLASKEQSKRTDYARDALRHNLIGIFIPASATFTGDLRNKPWQSEQEAEEYFVWRLNLNSCAALTHIIESCIEQYVTHDQLRPQAQADICRALSAAWTNNSKTYTTYDGLRLALSSIEMEHQAALRRKRTSKVEREPHEDHFQNDLFLPLKHAIRVIKNIITIPEGARWMVCLDEVEYLSEAHHRIINSHLRSGHEELIFKIATMPFAHHTLATNLADPVREGHDFEYVYVDREPIDSRGTHTEGEFLGFARHIFKRRMQSRNDAISGLTLSGLLGPSELLDEKRGDLRADLDRFMDMLRRHANPMTVARAERLLPSPKFYSEIYRKLLGALLLRDALGRTTGNSKLRIYSGESLIVRCCDGNPRRLMRLINLMLQRLEFTKMGTPILPIDPGIQNELLENLALEIITRTQSEPPNGELTSSYLNAIGTFMRWSFTSKKLGTDQLTSVLITEDDGPNAQKFIKQAIQLSLMIPGKDVPIKTPDYTCVGEFHISFLFAPFFRILPRRNRSVRLSRALSHGREVSRGHSRHAESQISLLEQE